MRFIVVPHVSTGKPAMSAAMRAMLNLARHGGDAACDDVLHPPHGNEQWSDDLFIQWPHASD